MKSVAGIIAGLALGIAGASPAFAWHLTPASTSFTGSGKTTAVVNGITLKCAATIGGHTDAAGIGYIDSGSFSGQPGCSYVSFQNTPWTSTAISRTTVDIDNVTFSTPIGNCGPGTLAVRLSRAGVFVWRNQSLPGGCVISGSISTSPKINIAKN